MAWEEEQQHGEDGVQAVKTGLGHQVYKCGVHRPL